MKTAQQSAFINYIKEFDKFDNTDEFNNFSPLVKIYQIQKQTTVYSPISSQRIMKLVMVHHHIQVTGGLSNILEHEFYGVFIRLQRNASPPATFVIISQFYRSTQPLQKQN
jgi:hypothetical protein